LQIILLQGYFIQAIALVLKYKAVTNNLRFSAWILEFSNGPLRN